MTALLIISRLLPAEQVSGFGPCFRLATCAHLVRTLSLQIGLAMLPLAAVCGALHRRLLAVGIAALATWMVLPALAWYLPHDSPPVAGESIRVMTCNLLRDNRCVDEIAEEVLAADADVVCFQECAVRWHEGLRTRLGSVYPYRLFVPRRYDMGLAIYSRRRLEGDSEWSDFRDDPPAQPLRTVIEIDGQPVALYNLHLFHPWPVPAMAARRAQFTAFLQRLDRETLPCIITGDFNATPFSPTMEALAARGLLNAWDLVGRGLGATWPDRPFLRRLPGLRIDHIFISPALTCTHCRVGRGEGSDHRPVIAELGFARRERRH